jgi:hypothetical protein
VLEVKRLRKWQIRIRCSSLRIMAVVVQELIEGNSLIVSIYLKGESLKIEGLVMIGGLARIGERR